MWFWSFSCQGLNNQHAIINELSIKKFSRTQNYFLKKRLLSLNWEQQLDSNLIIDEFIRLHVVSEREIILVDFWEKIRKIIPFRITVPRASQLLLKKTVAKHF